MNIHLFDPVVSKRARKGRKRMDRVVVESRRGITGPIYCHHCQREIKGRVHWIKLKPFCRYCYGFRAVLIPGMKDELPDHLKIKLRESVMRDQDGEEERGEQ